METRLPSVSGLIAHRTKDRFIDDGIRALDEAGKMIELMDPLFYHAVYLLKKHEETIYSLDEMLTIRRNHGTRYDLETAIRMQEDGQSVGVAFVYDCLFQQYQKDLEDGKKYEFPSLDRFRNAAKRRVNAYMERDGLGLLEKTNPLLSKLMWDLATFYALNEIQSGAGMAYAILSEYKNIDEEPNPWGELPVV